MINEIYGGWGQDWRVFVWRRGLCDRSRLLEAEAGVFVVWARVGRNFDSREVADVGS